MAWAARWFHVPCTVVVPEHNNPEINRIVESLGADLIVHGSDFYDAQSYCDELVDSAGYYYVEQGNEPEILNGLGTMGLEIFEDLPDVDVIICPIGGGSGCASLLKVAQAINPEVEIIGVQPERAAAFYESWKKGEWVTIEVADTVADGLAARSVFQLPYVIMKDRITRRGAAERRRDPGGYPAGPSGYPQPGRRRRGGSIAAALKINDRLAGKKVALIMSGGNLDHEHLVQALAVDPARSGASATASAPPGERRGTRRRRGRRSPRGRWRAVPALAPPQRRRALKAAVAARLAPMIVPDGYVEVQRLLESGAPLVFVSGNAGTGKTTLIRYLRENLDLRSVVLAPTGVAALNAGGATIHSFFRFPPRIQDLRDIRVPADRRLYQRLELLIIDEVSMLRGDILDSIDVFLRECRGARRAFGGVQLLLLGDMFQLPPVVSSAEREVLAARGYASPYFFSAHSLQDVPLAHVELDEVFRQTDPAFISLLNRLRVGEGTVAAVEELNRRCLRESSDHEITLTCTNRVADDLNEAAMAALDTEESVFVGESEGKFKLDGDRLPSPLDLRLKVGARVMFTKNDE